MKLHHWFSATTLAALLILGGGQALVGAEKKKDLASFGTLEPASLEAVRAEAEAWAKKTGLTQAKQTKFAAIWKTADLSLTERVTDTLLLDDAAAKLLAEARNPLSPAPTAVPAIIKDAKQPAFYRANLGLAYAKALSQRRVYEEALETLKAVKPEEVIDPAAYLFHRAVAEHAMLFKDQARRSISRLLDEVVDAPERYKTVGALMLLDMLTWKEKDLNWIARKMDNSGRRLELARGGPVTQKIQKDIVNRLDEIIKELENNNKGGS
jgi:hypothetical protein